MICVVVTDMEDVPLLPYKTIEVLQALTFLESRNISTLGRESTLQDYKTLRKYT